MSSGSSSRSGAKAGGWGACRIELDELPRLGPFIEIEGPDEKMIRSTMAALDLAGAETINESYVSMVAGLGAEGPVGLRFR